MSERPILTRLRPSLIGPSRFSRLNLFVITGLLGSLLVETSASAQLFSPGGFTGSRAWVGDCDVLPHRQGGVPCDELAPSRTLPSVDGQAPWFGDRDDDTLPPPDRQPGVDDGPPGGSGVDQSPDFGALPAFGFDRNRSLAGAGVGRGGYSAAPSMTGDLFGAGISIVSGIETFRFSESLAGIILNGELGGSANAVLGFDVGSGSPVDLFTGAGAGTNSDGNADQFSILEPIPPSLAPRPTGAGFVFQNGTAVFIGPEPFQSGSEFDVDYTFTRFIGGPGELVQLAGPDVATRRVKLSENFSAEVRDRCYMNYSYFNNAFGGLGDVNRWVLGMERILYEDMVSVEFRLPMAVTRSSRQDIDAPGARNYELGNLTTIAKIVMFRDERSIWTSGLGVTAPLADDSRLMRGNQTLLRIRNDSVHLLPYLGVLRRINPDTAMQFVTQLDVDTNGNKVSGDLSGGSLPTIGRLRDSTLMHLDASLHRSLLRQPRTHAIREVIGNAELHYTGSLENANVVSGNGVTVTDLARRFDIVNATISSHWLVGDHLVMTPGMSFPLTGGTNRQFDFEAVLQVNYLH